MTDREATLARVVRSARIYRDSTRNIRLDAAADPDGDVRDDWERLDRALADLDDIAAAVTTPEPTRKP